MIREKVFIWGFCAGAVLSSWISGVMHGCEAAAARTAAEKLSKRLEQNTQECDGTGLAATLRSCFDSRAKSCSSMLNQDAEACSRTAMDQCNEIARGAHCVGRKK